MSEDKRKNLRTQGRFSSGTKESPPTKEDKQKKNVTKSYSKERLRRNSPDTNTDFKKDSPMSSSVELKPRNEDIDVSIKYKENSNYAKSFSQLRPQKKAVEIREPGVTVLSMTENGESRILFKPDFIEPAQAYELHDLFMNTTEWFEKTLLIRGIEVLQPRLVAWYGPFPYEYSGVTLEPKEMTPTLLDIKKNVERYLMENGINVELNSVLLNYYRNDKDSVAWHSDDELSMGVCPTIASVSLGETRKFELRRKQTLDKNGEERDTKNDVDHFVQLKNGSLIVMDGVMQKDWQHRVPKEYHDKFARVNLTFRTVYALNDLNPYPVQEKYSISFPKYSEIASVNVKKQDFSEDFPPLNVSVKKNRDSTEILSHVDYKSTLDENEEFQNAEEEFQNVLESQNTEEFHNVVEFQNTEEFQNVENEYLLMKNEMQKDVTGLLNDKASNSDSKKDDINACSSSLLYSTNEFNENNLAPPIPAPVAHSFSNPNWPLDALNAPAFTSQNFDIQQVASSTIYNSVFTEKEEMSHNQDLNQYVSDGGSRDRYNNQDNPNPEYYHPLQSEQYIDPGACLEIAKWYLASPFEDTDSGKISKYVDLFKNVPFENYVEELHLTNRDCEELKVLTTVAQEAATLSDHCRNCVLSRLCRVIGNAEYYWNRDLMRVNNSRYDRRKPVRMNRFNHQNKY